MQLQYAFNQYSLKQQNLTWILSKRKGLCLAVENNILELMWQRWASDPNSWTECQLKKTFLRAIMLSGVWRRVKGYSGRGSTEVKGDEVIERNADSSCSLRFGSPGVVDAY